MGSTRTGTNTRQHSNSICSKNCLGCELGQIYLIGQIYLKASQVVKAIVSRVDTVVELIGILYIYIYVCNGVQS